MMPEPVPPQAAADAWRAYADAQAAADGARRVALIQLRGVPELSASEGAVLADLDHAADEAWIRYREVLAEPEPEAEIV